MYPSPDNLVQKMVCLHWPLQVPIDNSIAAAGIWQNMLMGSRAERSVDLERLRDLVNTEVSEAEEAAGEIVDWGAKASLGGYELTLTCR